MMVNSFVFGSGVVTNGHAYWRIYVTLAETTTAGYGVVIPELEFRATAGGADQVPVCTTYNMSPNGSVVYSQDNTTNEAWRAFDGDYTGDYWLAPTALPHWVGYHFASSVNVEQVLLQTYSDNRWTPKAFKIQWSDDGSTWYDRAVFSGLSLSASTQYTYSTVAPAAPTFSVAPSTTTDTGFYGEGDIATVSYTHDGASTTIRWLRNGSAISGATSATYTYVSGDVGMTVAPEVTAHASDFGVTTVASATGHTIVTPTFSTDTRVPAGDMDSGSDSRLTAGDMQSGTDLRVTTVRTA